LFVRLWFRNENLGGNRLARPARPPRLRIVSRLVALVATGVASGAAAALRDGSGLRFSEQLVLLEERGNRELVVR
jgi:hypothetical protein